MTAAIGSSGGPSARAKPPDLPPASGAGPSGAGFFLRGSLEKLRFSARLDFLPQTEFSRCNFPSGGVRGRTCRAMRRNFRHRHDGWGAKEKSMNIKKKMSNPFVLVAQGFVAGAILFTFTAPSEADSAPAPQKAETASALESRNG